MSDQVRIGGATVDRDEARDAAALYLTSPGLYGYPAYDAFDGGGDDSHLSDGDLLVPGLLNVHVRLPGFYSLTGLRPELEAWLSRVPPDRELTDGDDEGIRLLGELFGLLDKDVPHVGGTTIAKIMHRKRPRFVPLYDRYVWRCYVGAQDARIERVKNRTWQTFVGLLAVEIASDLRRENAWLTEIAAIAAEPSITKLRALDIVAWQTGRRHDVIDEEADSDPNATAPDSVDDQLEIGTP